MEQSNIKQYLQKVTDLAVDGGTRRTITLEHATEIQYWFQLTWDMINICYPFTGHPAIQLKQYGLDTEAQQGLYLVDWKANQYCTSEHDANDLDAIAGFILQYFKKALAINDDAAAWNIIEQ